MKKGKVGEGKTRKILEIINNSCKRLKGKKLLPKIKKKKKDKTNSYTVDFSKSHHRQLNTDLRFSNREP